jgi:hypothetical protein
MALYEFKDEKTHRKVLLELPMSGPVPSIGEVIIHQGREVRRIASDINMDVQYDGYFKDYGVRKGSPAAMNADAYDERGVPMWKGRRRAQDRAKQATDKGVPIAFNDE